MPPLVAPERAMAPSPSMGLSRSLTASVTSSVARCPQFDDLVVELFVGDQTAAVLLLGPFDLGGGALQNLRLLLRHVDVGDGDRDAGAGREAGSPDP